MTDAWRTTKTWGPVQERPKTQATPTADGDMVLPFGHDLRIVVRRLKGKVEWANVERGPYNLQHFHGRQAEIEARIYVRGFGDAMAALQRDQAEKES